ncbi:MAG: PQQ-binding-like beta-propeller repeat protein [Planctomycetota bacterium]
MRLALAAAVLLIGSSANAADWPHWRGEGGNGVSTSAAPPTTWSDSENVKWKAAVPGRGSGSPVVWGDRVFLVTAISPSRPESSAVIGGTLRFELRCYDRQTGRLAWRRVAVESPPAGGTHRTNGYASASPTTDGERVYAHFGSQGTYCYTMEGEPVWQRDLGDMVTRASFGEGSSPVLEGEKLLVPWDHEGPSALYALDAKTGETLWSAPRDEPTCWATPLVVDAGGTKQVVMNGQNYARAYDLASGEEVWRCGGQTARPVASPVAGAGLVFVGSGYRGSFLGAFSPTGSGDLAGTQSIRWSKSRDTPDIASLLLSGDRLYYYKGKSGLLTCVDAATGEPHYKTKRIGLSNIYASPVAAGGHVYLTDRDGTTVVIQDTAELNIVAKNSVGETVDATPAPVDGQLFIRGERHLFCIGE